MKSTSDLIGSLVNDCEPVTPLWNPARSTVVWGTVCLGFSAIALSTIGLSDKVPTDLSFWLGESALIVCLAFSALWASFSLSIPGSEISRPWRIPAFFFAAWFLYLRAGLAYNVLHHGSSAAGHVEGSECAVLLGSLLVFPAILLVGLIRRGLPILPHWAGFAAITAGAAFATLAVEFYCPTHTVVHHFAYHLAPAVLFGVLGYAVAHKLFSKN